MCSILVFVIPLDLVVFRSRRMMYKCKGDSDSDLHGRIARWGIVSNRAVLLMYRIDVVRRELGRRTITAEIGCRQ